MGSFPAQFVQRVPALEAEIHRPLVEEILELKKSKKAVILAHTYQSPEIYFGVADIRGDSLQLAREAMLVQGAERIVLCGVKFMAETAKILNPDRTVLLPDLRAGCSMANSITAADVRALREQHPGCPVVSYVNTNADVKAETDICCTSSNAVRVVESLGASKIIFLPDPHLGRWVQSQVPGVEMVLWDGPCEVHVEFTAEKIRELKEIDPELYVMVHPECNTEVIREADFTGSTSGMIKHIGEKKLKRIALITECSMGANITEMYPGTEVIRPCNLCPHMQRITLEKVRDCLLHDQFEIEIEESIRARAQSSLTRMLEVGAG